MEIFIIIRYVKRIINIPKYFSVMLLVFLIKVKLKYEKGIELNKYHNNNRIQYCNRH